jgi:hypothetical protein
MPGWYCEQSEESIHTGEDMKVSDRMLNRLKTHSEGLGREVISTPCTEENSGAERQLSRIGAAFFLKPSLRLFCRTGTLLKGNK